MLPRRPLPSAADSDQALPASYGAGLRDRSVSVNIVRVLLRAILVLLVLGLALLIVLGALSVRPTYLRERVRDILAQELAQSTARQVQVGDIGGNLLTGVTVRNLAIADEGGFQRGPVLAAERMVIKYDLPAVLSGQIGSLASIKAISLERAYARVERSADGSINLQKLFKPRPPRRLPPEQQFQALITVHDSVVDLVAEGLAGHTLRTRLTPVNGSVKIEPVGPMRLVLSTGSADGAFGRLALQALADPAESYVIVRGSLESLPLGRWSSLLPPSTPLRVTGGSASARFQAWVVPKADAVVGPVASSLPPGEKASVVSHEVGYYTQVELRSLALSIASSTAGGSGLSRRLDLRVDSASTTLTPQGMQIVNLHAVCDGQPVRATGWLYDLAHPRADLQIRMPDLDMAALRRLLPPDSLPGLRADLAGRGDLTADLIGPLQNLNATLSLSLPHGTLLTTERTGEVLLDNVALQASLWDSERPATVASLVASDASLDTALELPPLVAPADAAPSATPSVLSLHRLGEVRAQALLTGDAPLVQATATGLEGEYEGAGFTGLEVDLSLAGGSLHIPRLRANLLGGQVEAEALISLPHDRNQGFRAVANGRAEGLDLAHLPPWPMLVAAASHLGGVVSADFGLAWAEGRGELATSLQAREPNYRSYTATRVQALARAEFLPGGDWRVELPQAEVEKGGAQAALWGQASRDGGLDLQAELGAVELAELPREGERLDGRAYGHLRLTGTFRDPVVAGQLAVFAPRYGDYQADALLADFSALPASLSPEDLVSPRAGQVEAYASYDTAVAATTLVLTPPPPGQDSPQVAGELSVGGVRLERLPALVGDRWPTELNSLIGRGQLRATVNGTVAAPTLRGEVDLTRIDYRDYLIDAVRAPFALELAPRKRERLVVQGGSVALGGAGLTFDATVENLSADWDFLLQARGRDLYLERLSSALPVRLPVAGELFLPQVTLRGSASGVSGEGRLLAPQITLGDSSLTGVDTHFVVDRGKVRLERTSLHAAGGQVEAELAYGLHERFLEGEVVATDLDLSAVLALVAPVAAVLEESPETATVIERRWRQRSLRAQGRLTAAVQLHGPLKAVAGTASLNLGEVSYEERFLPDLRGTLAFDLGRRQLTDLNVEAQVGQALMTLAGHVQIGGALALFVDASNVDLAAWRDWLPRGLGLGGVAGITVEARGTTDAPEVTASVDVLSPSVRGVSFDLVSVPVVRVAQGGIDLDRIILKREDREIVASGHLPFSWDPLGVPLTEPVSFTAGVDNTDLGFFPPILNELTRYARQSQPDAAPSFWTDLLASGTVNSQLKVAGTLADPIMEGYLRLNDGAVSRSAWKTPATNLTADVTVHRAGAGNLIEIHGLSGRWEQTSFALTGFANLKVFERTRLGENTFDLALNLAAEQQPLWGSQKLTGFQGTVSLTTKADGVQALRFTGMEGTVGQGRFALTGTVNLTQFRISALPRNDFDLHLQTSALPVEYPGLLRGELDGALHVQNPAPGERALIRGGFTLDHAAFGFPQVSGGSAEKPLVGLSRPVPDFGLDVKLALGPDVSLKTPTLTAPFVPTATALVTQGSLLRPSVRGALATRPSEGTLPGTSFVLRGLNIAYALAPESGHERPPFPLLLTGGYRGMAEQTLPYVEVDGRNIGPVHLTMTIDGNFAEMSKGPTVRVTAEPPLTQEQIAVLVGLQGMVPGGTTDLDELLSERFVSIVGRGLREALFTPLQTQLRRALGLTEFTVLFAFGQPLEVRLSKYLVRNFLVSYRYSVIGPRNEQWTLAVNYDLPGNYRVSYSTNESEETQFRVSRSWSF